MSPIKGIFFDAAGVFYERKQKTGDFATDLLAKQDYRVQLTEEEHAREQDLHAQATIGRINHEEYWNQLLQMYGVSDQVKRDALSKRILAYTFEVFGYPGARSTLAELKQRGFVLGIVTDTMYPVEWKMSWLDKVGVAKYIDVISCSSILGKHKPNPEIYLNALSQARLTLPESVFVGHAAHELEGARRVGLTTVAVNYDTGVQADYYCESLPDLLRLPILQKDLSQHH